MEGKDILRPLTEEDYNNMSVKDIILHKRRLKQQQLKQQQQQEPLGGAQGRPGDDNEEGDDDDVGYDDSDPGPSTAPPPRPTRRRKRKQTTVDKQKKKVAEAKRTKAAGFSTIQTTSTGQKTIFFFGELIYTLNYFDSRMQFLCIYMRLVPDINVRTYILWWRQSEGNFIHLQA